MVLNCLRKHLPSSIGRTLYFTEKEITDCFLSEHPSKFLEGEEWNQGHENHQRSGEQFVRPAVKEFRESARNSLSRPQTLDPVSYTHLDVYKRQGSKRR